MTGSTRIGSSWIRVCTKSIHLRHSVQRLCWCGAESSPKPQQVRARRASQTGRGSTSRLPRKRLRDKRKLKNSLRRCGVRPGASSTPTMPAWFCDRRKRWLNGGHDRRCLRGVRCEGVGEAVGTMCMPARGGEAGKLDSTLSRIQGEQRVRVAWRLHH